MKLREVSEIRKSMMTSEEQKASDERHDKFYTQVYGQHRDIQCSSTEEDYDQYLQDVDLDNL